MSIKKKIATTFTIVAIAIGAMGYFVIWPTYQEIHKITASIQQERMDLEIKYQRGQQMKKLAAQYQKVKQYRDRLNTMFIPSGDELAFITTLERVKEEFGIDATPSLGEIGSDLAPEAALPLTITVRGDYLKILRYLIALERLQYSFNITSISFNTIDSDRGEVSAVLSGQAFRKPYPKKTEGAAPTATGNAVTPQPDRAGTAPSDQPPNTNLP
ncbi:MAG: hypothetical protein PHI63_06535 [Patescibacteria group bacterium]|nr:hypothetical protein [Patescibacteria group bacterium]